MERKKEWVKEISICVRFNVCTGFAYACVWVCSVCVCVCVCVCVKGSVCDECIGGTVGCVLKISHTQQPVPTLQREITQPCRQRGERERECVCVLPLSQRRCVVQFSGVAASRQVQVEGRGVKRREGASCRHRVELRPQRRKTQGLLHPVVDRQTDGRTSQTTQCGKGGR